MAKTSEEMNQAPLRSGTTIRVEPNGIRLGWNVLALLATLGLGLYVTSVVSPIVSKLSGMDEKIANQHNSSTTLTALVNEHLELSAGQHAELRERVKHASELYATLIDTIPQTVRAQCTAVLHDEGEHGK